MEQRLRRSDVPRSTFTNDSPGEVMHTQAMLGKDNLNWSDVCDTYQLVNGP